MFQHPKKKKKQIILNSRTEKIKSNSDNSLGSILCAIAWQG